MATNNQKQISQATVAELASAIATALSQSGGGSGQRYNPISNSVSKGEDPASRVADIRSYKVSQNTSSMLRELTELQRRSVRTSQELERLMKFNSKTTSEAVSKFESFEEAQTQLVKELRRQLDAKGTPAAIKAMAGKIDTLEDVFRFNDTAKATAELAKALNHSRSTNENFEQVVHQLEDLKNKLPAGKTLADVDTSLDALNTRIERFLQNQNGAYDAASQSYVFSDQHGNARSDADQKRLNDSLRDMITKSALGARAQQAADTLAMQSHTAAVNGNVQALKKLDSVGSEASRRIKEWAVRVGSSAYILDKLSEAAQHLYRTTQAAAATGTQRSFSAILGREVASLIHGVSVEAVQASQKDHARQRNAAGREEYDSALYAGASDFFKLTGDRSEAMAQMANTTDIIGKTGVSFKLARDSAAGLYTTFNQLSMATGMTLGEINAINDDLTAGYEYRQQMHALDQRQRAASLINLDMMLKENVLRGIAIQQSRDMIKAQQDMAAPFSPKNRLKNSVMLRQLGAAQGVNVGAAADFIQAGGPARYRDQLMRSGMSAEQANAQVSRARDQFNNVGTLNSGKLAGNDAAGFMTEAIGERMGPLKSLFDGTHDINTAGPQAIIGKAAEQFQEGSKEFAAGVGLMTSNWISTFSGSALGALGGGIAAMIGKNLLMRNFGGMSGGAATGSIMSRLGTGIRSMGGSLGSRASSIIGSIRGGTTGFNAIPTSSSFFSRIGGSLGSMGSSITSRIPSMSGGLSGALGALRGASPRMIAGLTTASKAAGPIGAALSTLLLGYHAFNNDDHNTKVKNISGDVGGIGGSLAMAGTLGAVGTAIAPGPGTLIGGLIGAIIGAIGGHMAGEAVGAHLVAPTAPTPSVNNNQATASEGGSIDTNNRTNNASTSDSAAAPNHAVALAQAVTDMNGTLDKMLQIMQTSSGDMSESSAKALAMQDKIRRVLKSNSGVAADPLPASQAYNT